jgi:outer membrane protein assembly factor BamA
MLAASAAAAPRPDWRVPTDPTTNGALDLDPSTPTASETETPAEPGITPVFAPIPFKNSQLGWGLMLMAMAIHRFDPDTTIGPSTGGVGGFYTENKSWGAMAFEAARLAHDSWRVRVGLSHFDINYKFYGIGEDAGSAGHSVDLEQTMDFGMGSALYRVAPKLYFGPAMVWMRTTASLDSTALPPDISVPSGDTRTTDLFAPGLQGERDTRNDDYWPTTGSLGKVKSWFFTSALGGSRDFQRYVVTWSQYLPLRERLTLAANANMLAAAGDVPFYMLPSVGSGENGLRGYTQGRYRDKVAVTLQAEARWHSQGRMGATAFGGFGQVAPSVGKLTDALVLPAGGLGLRYQLTNEYPMHMRFDVAWGRKEALFYFSVGEAF